MKKQIYINLFAQGISFAVSFVISFFISPIIVQSVGKEAYGFLGVANNFTSYITIVTVALNSLAGRFVTVSLYKKQLNDMNEYFSSVFFANLIIVCVLAVPVFLFIVFIDNILVIPSNQLIDVQITFGMVFLGFFINLIGSIFSVSTFATNKIYLASIRTIEANLLRLIVIVLTFTIFSPKIEFVSLSMLIYTSFIVLTNYKYTKKLLSQIKIKLNFFNFNKIKEIIFSGCWSSITALSNTLLEGLDLLISNIFIGASAMGTISIVKTVPNIINQCMGSILSVFTPQLTIDYAKDNINEMVSYLDYSCKVVSTFLSLPLAFVFVFGDKFFSLWMPTESALELWGLSVLSMGSLVFAGSVVIMHNLFTVTNKLRTPAIVTLLTGIINTVIVLFLLKYTDLGMYAIVSVSSVLAFLRNIIFNIPYSAKCIGISKKKFYKIALRSVLFVMISCIFGLIFKYILLQDTWVHLIENIIIMCICSIFFIVLIFYTKKEKKELIFILKKLKK